MLAQFEIYFGRTLVRSQQGEFVVEKTKGRIIRDRFVKSERLLLFFHPEFHDSFKPILNMIIECREKINAKADVVDKEEKIKFLQGLETIVTEFEKDEKPFENAMEDFQRILSNIYLLSLCFLNIVTLILLTTYVIQFLGKICHI